MEKMKKMTKKVDVSVVVPVYNVPENYLKRCIERLINQTYKNIEILLIDDGSKNNSGKICDDYAEKDERIKVYHKKNGGLCSARNYGTKKANGEWLSYVDGDDWIEPNTYEKLIDYTKKCNDDLDLIFFGYIKDYPSRSIEMKYDNFENEKLYSSKEEIEFLQKMVLNYNANIAMVPTKFIRNEFIKKNELYHVDELKQGAEGIEFNFRLFKYAKKALFVENRYYHYIFNDNSITTVHNEKNHYLVLNCFNKIKKEIDKDDSALMDCFYDRMNYVILTTAISGFFSPTNKEPYKIQKKKFKAYLSNNLVAETLNRFDISNLDIIRKITMILIKNRMFFLVKIISKLRYNQKNK